MSNGNEIDVYGIVLEAIVLYPPLISITIDELKDRVDELIENSNGEFDWSHIDEDNLVYISLGTACQIIYYML